MGWIKGEGEIEDSYKISKIAAHVPDLVVYSTLTNDIPYAENFHGVLLFADVSGKPCNISLATVASHVSYLASQHELEFPDDLRVEAS